MPSNRVAFVTGAGQGIGRGIALRLAEDGLDVAVNDLPEKKEQLAAVVAEIESKGRRALGLTGNVTSEADVKSMIDKVVFELGSLDVMVANAGIVVRGLVTDTDMDDYDRVMSINARGIFMCFKYAGVQMIKQGRGGRIIGACSVAGKRGLPDASAYCMSKFAVRGLTQSCATEWSQHNITVNSYAPGWVETGLMEDVRRLGRDLTGVLSTEPSTIAGLVSYLVRPEAYFITGQSVVIDGGFAFMD